MCRDVENGAECSKTSKFLSNGARLQGFLSLGIDGR
jgi:hypothetical protein